MVSRSLVVEQRPANVDKKKPLTHALPFAR